MKKTEREQKLIEFIEDMDIQTPKYYTRFEGITEGRNWARDLLLILAILFLLKGLGIL